MREKFRGFSIKMLEEKTDIDDLNSLKKFQNNLYEKPGPAPNTHAVENELNMLTYPEKSMKRSTAQKESK